MKKDNIIKIELLSKENIFNNFNRNQISNDFSEYITRCIHKVPFNVKPVMIICDNNLLTEEERRELVVAIREYYELLISEKMSYSKFNKIKKILLFIIGILLILLSDFLTNLFELLIPELFLIAGWVAIWEAVDSILFADNKNRIEMKRAKQLAGCKIIFDENKNE